MIAFQHVEVLCKWNSHKTITDFKTSRWKCREFPSTFSSTALNKKCRLSENNQWLTTKTYYRFIFKSSRGCVIQSSQTSRPGNLNIQSIVNGASIKSSSLNWYKHQLFLEHIITYNLIVMDIRISSYRVDADYFRLSFLFSLHEQLI